MEVYMFFYPTGVVVPIVIMQALIKREMNDFMSKLL